MWLLDQMLTRVIRKNRLAITESNGPEPLRLDGRDLGFHEVPE